jgi:DNA-binding response OmpR family regulator
MQNSKPILLVAYDRLTVLTVKRTFSELRITNQLIERTNGEQALEYLTNKDSKKPCLILLDFGIPEPDGVKFLGIIKADKTLKKIPVIALTASDEERDVIDSLRLGVATYLFKPVDYRKFIEATKTIPICWTLSEMPDGE